MTRICRRREILKWFMIFSTSRGCVPLNRCGPIRGERKPTIGGMTCEDAQFLNYHQLLQKRGFEIGYHNSTYHGVEREKIEEGLNRFRKNFGHDPRTMSNHADSVEAIYWGDARVTGFQKWLYNLLSKNRQKNAFFGHVPGERYFWGDLCSERIKYVRNFITSDINTLKACPWMPLPRSIETLRQVLVRVFRRTQSSFFQRDDSRRKPRSFGRGGRRLHYVHALCLWLSRRWKTEFAFQKFDRKIVQKKWLVCAHIHFT